VTVAHPLGATVQRGRSRHHEGCDLGARHGAQAGADWTTTASLCSEGRCLRALLVAIGDDAGSQRRDVQASLLLEAYAWTLLLPVAGAVVAESRSPGLAPDRTAMRFGPGGRPTDVTFGDPSWIALSSDDHAGHPDAIIVADLHALTARLRDELVAHLHPLIAALRQLAPRPERALWRGVADRTAAAFLWAGEATSERDHAERLVSEVLAGGPLQGRPCYRLVDDDGRARRIHLRSGCCLWWRTRAATPCLSCPLGEAGRERDRTATAR
jgi:ferric iron reductase protein FhuF